ncbi:hypothetical protein Rsub_09817 [Raphidocelis subcapitata]|uniref:Formate nitrite transporter n=1 Tax=Raphidocelis subcapitata TaxID=307507 RepID=A0A2V0PHG5_9CHLO|nr:hypothetical protein Rsub_09817 [Raphidocelis subcapitata]|eukprot:GBF96475.1 hypothetical protein Rsub_09817 [Raphidocelis subcapitata]
MPDPLSREPQPPALMVRVYEGNGNAGGAGGDDSAHGGAVALRAHAGGGGAAAAPAACAAATGPRMLLTPPEVYAACVRHGADKAACGWFKLLVLTVMAGAYVGVGFSLALLIGGNLGLDIYKERPGLFSLLLGAVGFPTGFTLIVIAGGELFTSLCLYMAVAWWEGRASGRDFWRLLAVSWVGNFAGAGLMVGLMLAAGSFDGKAAFTVGHGFGRCFVLGVLCNFLVCLATWMANAAQDMTGKFVAIWLPISAFVAMGFEHTIANQYLLPLAATLGRLHPDLISAVPGARHLSAYDLVVGNLIPTTLGNVVGGALCVGTAYACAYGAPHAAVARWAARGGWWRRRRGARGPAAAAAAAAAAAVGAGKAVAV